MTKRRPLILPFLCLALFLAACAGPEPAAGEPTVQRSEQPTATVAAPPSPTPAPATPTASPTSTPQPTEPAASAYLSLRRSYATALTAHRPAPFAWHDAPLPAGVTQVSYPSGDLTLRAWLAMPRPDRLPAGCQACKVPAVVYFHGYFGLGWDEFAHVQPFLDAGYAVLLPALRGENGNPGDFELWYGEIDDARAAVQWLAAQPEIDAGHIYAFGWSVGGGVATLLSLWDDVPVRFIGSSGGLYTADIFPAWNDIVPFDLNDAQEVQLRLLRGNMASMQHRHIAYLGQDEWLATFAATAEAEAQASGAPLEVHLIPGDHYTALPRAIAAFIQEMQAGR